MFFSCENLLKVQKRGMTRKVCPLIILSVFALSLSEAGIVKLAESGDPEPAPSGTNVFFQIGHGITLNSEGQVAFVTDLRHDGFLQGYGAYLADQAGVQTIARVNEPAPGANGNFYSFYDFVALNSTSQVFQANLRDSLNGANDDTGIFQVSGAGLKQVVRAGAPPPQGGIFRSFQGVPARVNQAGQVAFKASTTSHASAVFLSTGGTLKELAFAGQPLPEGGGTFSLFNDVALNDKGQVAFSCLLVSTSFSGIYLADGNSVTALVKGGQALPDDNGNILILNSTAPALNNKGEIAFVATLTGTTDGNADNLALCRADKNGLTQLARKGEFVPGGNGRFLDFGPGQSQAVINSTSAVAFLADITGSSGGIADNIAICLANGTNLIQVARKGQPVPDGNGTFASFGLPALNNRGQIAFTAKLTGTSGGSLDNEGIFVTDPALKIMQAVRSGIKVGSETLSGPTFVSGPDPGGVSGFNDDGDLAFLAGLNGNAAVFLWSQLIIGDVTHAADTIQMSLSLPSGTTNYVQATSSLKEPFQDIAGPIVAAGRRIRTNFVQQVPAEKTTIFYRGRQLSK
jgi:hypothetical protein